MYKDHSHLTPQWPFYACDKLVVLHMVPYMYVALDNISILVVNININS